MSFGFIRVGVASPELHVANCTSNAEKIIHLLKQADEKNVKVVAFPELSLTGYSCGDLFFQQQLLSAAQQALQTILSATAELDVIAFVGMPLIIGVHLFNVAISIHRGKILGVVPKTYLPNQKEYYEARWFSPSWQCQVKEIVLCDQIVPVGTDLLFHHATDESIIIGVEICEDLWAPIPVSSQQAINGATILVNLSASNEQVGKQKIRRQLVENQSRQTVSAYLYTSSDKGESTTDLVYSGVGLIAEQGEIVVERQMFSDEPFHYTEIDTMCILQARRQVATFAQQTSTRNVSFYTENPTLNLTKKVNPHPFLPAVEEQKDFCEEVIKIQTAGLVKRMEYLNRKRLIIGVSGGLDSTLALHICVNACEQLNLGTENILAITMPGFGTTDRTLTNAHHLMEAYGVTSREISIKEITKLHYQNIGHDETIQDLTYEQAQSRERTQILLDLANKEHGIVVGTGDLSEMALGWMTYSGDHISMYSVNMGLTKTMIRFIVSYLGKTEAKQLQHTLQDILATPISPELLPPDKQGKIQQQTEQLVGPYEVHDFFIYHVLKHQCEPKKILYLARHAFGDKYQATQLRSWLKLFYERFFTRQYKRSCLPDGPMVGDISLSPRGFWRMPSDASPAIWLEQLNH